MNDIARIEQKVEVMADELKQLREVITTLARVDERMINQQDDINGFGKRLAAIEERFDQRLRAVETKVTVTAVTGKIAMSWTERIIWIIVAAAFAGINYFKGN